MKNDDNDNDDDDDDDDVQETRTRPFAVCDDIYNMKLAMMQKTTHFTTFSTHTKMTIEKRGQDEVFGRIVTIYYILQYHVRAFPFPPSMISPRSYLHRFHQG